MFFKTFIMTRKTNALSNMHHGDRGNITKGVDNVLLDGV